MVKQQNDLKINQLLKIMQQLRDPDSGCPWDIEQNFSSIAPYTIEEAYEVADAIARNNMNDLRDELGDLLLQTVFHAQMAKEKGEFDFDDVVQAICDKMIRRHPHVFAEASISNAAEQTNAWEEQKSLERDNKGANGVLDDVPIALPASARALKLQTRAANVGFDWPDLEPIFAKLQEEIKELQDGISTGKNKAYLEKEMGDILFVCINLARKLQLNPETALSLTNSKFISRFQFIEEALMAQGKTPKQSNLQEMDKLWDQAKLAE